MKLSKEKVNVSISEHLLHELLNLFEISCERSSCRECNLVEIKGSQDECRARFVLKELIGEDTW